jgi:4-amino-4-deoxy-L-arabinose transferase-like glycosyltransferase
MVWLVLVGGSLATGLGGHALIDPDEGRSASVGWAMAVSGDYVVPRLDGLPHLDKPPLFHAGQALAFRVLGPSEAAARLPALLSAWATIALTTWFARRLFGRETAWVAGVACATAPLTIAMARTAIFDSTLTLFVVLALVAFYFAVEGEEDQARPSTPRRWALLAWGAMALGVLTKGPVALLVPLLVAAPYAAWRRRSRRVWHPSGPAFHLLALLPWVLAVEARVPGFLRYALVTETWQRLTTDELHRGGPLWYFLPYLVAGAFPWVLVVAAAGIEPWRRYERRQPLVYLVLWVAVPLVFFSLSQSKRPQYVLPLVPALALMTAWAWNVSHPRPRGIRAGAAGWLLGGGLLAVAAVTVVAARLGGDGSLAATARTTALVLGAVMIVSGTLAWLASARRGVSIVALSLPLALLPAITAPLMARVARSRSGSELAAALRPHLRPDTQIVGIETFSPSLTFYLGRPIHVSSSSGQPLGSNYILRSYSSWVGEPASTLHEPGWWQEALRSRSSPRVFLLERRYERERRTLAAAGMPVCFESRRLVAMGPCRPLGSGS